MLPHNFSNYRLRIWQTTSTCVGIFQQRNVLCCQAGWDPVLQDCAPPPQVKEAGGRCLDLNSLPANTHFSEILSFLKRTPRVGDFFWGGGGNWTKNANYDFDDPKKAIKIRFTWWNCNTKSLSSGEDNIRGGSVLFHQSAQTRELNALRLSGIVGKIHDFLNHFGESWMEAFHHFFSRWEMGVQRKCQEKSKLVTKFPASRRNRKFHFTKLLDLQNRACTCISVHAWSTAAWSRHAFLIKLKQLPEWTQSCPLDLGWFWWRHVTGTRECASCKLYNTNFC